MFLHKPLFTLRNEEQSLSHVRAFITLGGDGRRTRSSLAGCSFQLHSDEHRALPLLTCELYNPKPAFALPQK